MNGVGDISLLKNGKMLLALLVLDWLFAGSTDATTRKSFIIYLAHHISFPLHVELTLLLTITYLPIDIPLTGYWYINVCVTHYKLNNKINVRYKSLPISNENED